MATPFPFFCKKTDGRRGRGTTFISITKQNGVGYAGFEPATSPLSGVRSNQLS